MPIFDYRCDKCGHAEEVLQRNSSDTPLTICPKCQAESFKKQLSAPSFHLKGTGWYVTDYRDPPKAKASDKNASDKMASANKPSGTTENTAATADTSEKKSTTSTETPSAPAAEKPK